MTKKRNIQDLLDKFVSDSITREELDFLYHSVNHNLHTEEIKAWLYRGWDEAPEKNHKISSHEMFASLVDRIQDHSLMITGRSWAGKKTKVLRILSYAAILIAGFFLSWWVRSVIFPDSNTDETALNEIRIPLGSKSKITLSDGTQVWLNSGSTLKYPGRFKENRRDIFLEGEAYFDVTHDETRPFYVNTSEIHIKVLGTQFNVKSYPDETLVETTLVTGSIEIVARQSGQKKQLQLAPNQKATFSKLTSQLSLQDIPKPEIQKQEVIGIIEVEDQISTEIITSWKDNKLVFNRERFEEIAIRLERWYNVQIILEDEQVKDFRYTGTFENETLEQALMALNIASPFDYTIDKNTIIINSKK